MNTAEVTRLVRAELERGDIPAEVLSNNTIEVRGHFITTVVLVERSVRRGEHGRVQVFIDGQPRYVAFLALASCCVKLGDES